MIKHTMTSPSQETMRSALSFQNVSKAFGSLRVINNVSFEVATASRTALIGPNGAGKTTIFNLISGVYGINKGNILVNGESITHLSSRHRIGRGLARNFQNIRLMQHLTVVENLLLGQHPQTNGIRDLLTPFRFRTKHRWQEEARDALENAGLLEYANATVGALPYGVRKRIDLVRATLANPRILMLDEPAAGLNTAETDELTGDLQRLSGLGITLLIVEHDMQFIRSLCDHIVVLNFGEKIAEGQMSEIQKNKRVREAYLGSQAEDIHAS